MIQRNNRGGSGRMIHAGMAVLIVPILLIVLSCGSKQKSLSAFKWPDVSRECKPWTYWWWMGSAVDKTSLAKNLEDYKKAGIGGVHIIPIYGVKGYEERFIPYLSQEWMEMLAFTSQEAARLGMGVDMTTGTGWPYGGPNVDPGNASSKVRFETFTLLEGGNRFTHTFAMNGFMALMAFPKEGTALDLTDKVDRGTGNIDWEAPSGNSWSLYAVFQEGTGQQVKRAAPGGEGNVIDYFSAVSLKNYLARFDSAFARYGKTIPLRAFYNDSYEVYGSNWTDDLFREFIRLRAYDLRMFLPELTGKGQNDIVARVRHDYNETVSDLLLTQFTVPWVMWSHDKGCFTRDQAHGSPGNLLDLYAAADIPETEAFGTSGFPIPGLRIDPDMPEHFGKPDILVEKFASSAAHVTGKQLVSSESCTWLGEHFKVALSQVKPEIDALFVAGINHVFFHGIAYSPKDTPWPGWLFYASTNFGQSNTFWRDFPELNAYIARCQSFLQNGLPAHDVLLYWPIHDVWRTGADEDMLHHFQVHNANQWFYGTPFHDAAQTMWDRGFTFDYISDRQIAVLKYSSGEIRTGADACKVLIVPGCGYMPGETLEKLVNLARSGAIIIVTGSLPEDVPGLANLREGRQKIHASLDEIRRKTAERDGIKVSPVGKGAFLVGSDLERMLTMAGVSREPVVDKGIEFVRRTYGSGYHYFMTNLGEKTVDGWVPLGVKAASAVIFDPLSAHNGSAEIRKGNNGETQVYLHLEPGQSLILRTVSSGKIGGPKWEYREPDGDSVGIQGPWEITFVDGGPKLPQKVRTDSLVSWTELRDTDARNFGGTARYTVTFRNPALKADDWMLDLGRVCESARVRLNGEDKGCVWCFPYTLSLGSSIRDGDNILEIEVTNLGANRIADMDRRGVPWKIFYDINFVNIKYEEFNASVWLPVDSGLIGPVRLQPVKYRFAEKK